MTTYFYCQCCDMPVVRSMEGMSAGWAIFILLLGLLTAGLAWLMFLGALVPRSAVCVRCGAPVIRLKHPMPLGPR